MSDSEIKKREVAVRIFAREYSASRHVVKHGDELSPSYVLSPLGALANRVFISGVVTEIQNIKTERDPYWKVRISDPTGMFFLNAGRYQPQLLKVFPQMEIPSFVSVIGKTRTYLKEDGFMYVSIIPEAIAEITKDARDLWIMDTVHKTWERLSCMSAALSSDSPSGESLIKQGFHRLVSQGVMEALNLYDEIPITHFQKMLLDSLRAVAEGDETIRHGIRPNRQIITEEEKILRRAIMTMIHDLDLHGEGAIYQDLIDRIGESKIKREDAEDTITKLLDDGHLFEPVLGRLMLV